jgi:hypothetical protein
MDVLAWPLAAAAAALFAAVAFQHLAGYAAVADIIGFHDAPVAQLADAVTVFVLEPAVGMHNCVVFIMHPEIDGEFVDYGAEFFLGYAQKRRRRQDINSAGFSGGTGPFVPCMLARESRHFVASVEKYSI